MEKQIPEHKRRALVFQAEEKQKESLSERLRRRIYSYVKETALEEELKKNNVSMEDFREVDR